MPLIQFVIILIVVGVLLWVVNTYIPMSRSIKGILNVVVVLVMIGFTLNLFGLFGHMNSLRIGR